MLGRPEIYEGVMRLRPTFVRIVASWNRLEPAPPKAGIHYWNTGALAALDREISFFEARRVAVLLDFHQVGWSPFFVGGRSGVPAWYYKNERFGVQDVSLAEAAFWTKERARSLSAYEALARFVVRRYVAWPNVFAYEFVNEPPTGTLRETGERWIVDWQTSLERRIAPFLAGRLFVLSCCATSDAEVARMRLALSEKHDYSPESLAVDYHDYWMPVNDKSLQRYTGTVSEQRAHLLQVSGAFKGLSIPVIVGEWGIRQSLAGGLTYQAQLLDVFKVLHAPNARWFFWPNDDDGWNLLDASNAPTALAVQLEEAWRRPATFEKKRQATAR